MPRKVRKPKKAAKRTGKRPDFVTILGGLPRLRLKPVLGRERFSSKEIVVLLAKPGEYAKEGDLLSLDDPKLGSWLGQVVSNGFKLG